MWVVVDLARGAERAPGAKADGTTGRPRHPLGTALGRPATLRDVTAIIGGLGAAMLWAAATLCSSRSSRMLGSRVVLGWIMVVGVVVGVPLAVISPGPATVEPSTYGLLGLAGICYVVGLQLTYAALRIGKVSIVAPIVATEGAIAALIALTRGDPLGFVAGASLAVVVTGVVLSTLEPGRADVAAGDFDVVADAIDEPPPTQPPPTEPPRPTETAQPPNDSRRATLLAVGAALIFGVGLVASGTAASLVPVAWVALAARVVGLVVVVVPLVLAGRMRVTRGRAPAGAHRRGRRGPRLDAVGVGIARQHPDHGGHGQPVRDLRRRRRVLPVRRTARAAPDRGRRAHRGRGDGPRGLDGLTFWFG